MARPGGVEIARVAKVEGGTIINGKAVPKPVTRTRAKSAAAVVAAAVPAVRSASPAPGDEAILALERLISFRLSLLTKLLERRLARLVGGEFGLAVAEYRVLAQIIMRPESTVRDIAARTLVDKAQVSRSVAALEEQKLVTRSVPTTDRRSPVLTATRSGKMLVRRIAPLRQAQEQEILAGLEPSAVENFRQTLDALFEGLMDPQDEAPQPTVAQRRAAMRQKARRYDGIAVFRSRTAQLRSRCRIETGGIGMPSRPVASLCAPGGIGRHLFDETHESFREAVRRFVQNEVVPNLIEWDAQGFVPRSFYTKAAAVGMLGFAFDEAYGGLGIKDFRYSVVINEELSRVGAIGVSMGVCGLNDLVGPYLCELGTEVQRQRWQPSLADGSTTMALAMSEPDAGSDLSQIQSTAVACGDGYLLNGSKTFISNGITADRFIVLARTDPAAGRRGLSLLVVDANSAGFERGPALKKIGLLSQDTAEVFFSDVFLPRENLLGPENGAWKAMMRNLAVERMSVAVTALASTEGVLTETLEYVKGRRVFGQSIGSLQHNMFLLAELATHVRVTAVFLDHSIQRLVDGQLSPAEAAMAKLATTELQQRVIYKCQQLFGGYGYMREQAVARAFVDARASTIYAGSSEIMKEIIGRELDLK